MSIVDPETAAVRVEPLRGEGRADLARLADQSLLALRPWASPGRARFDLPGARGKSGRNVDGFEAFARSFLGAGFMLSGATEDPHDHAGWYAEGLIAGTGGSASERWGDLRVEHQNRVEAAEVALALHESRAWIWDRLSPLAQEQIVDWLSGSTGAWYPESNWYWFHNVVHAFLRSVGADHDQARIDETLEFFESCYIGDGWYSDGRANGRLSNVDWYSGWVMQLYSLWYCRMSEGQPGIVAREQQYRERLRPYISSALELHGDDGAPLHQGRSLTYRHATVGALWAGAIFDASPVPLPELRGAALRGIEYFATRGVYDANGLLSLGWHGEFSPMRQDYSGPGSPYWANLGLAGLVLPTEHPLWSSPPAAPPETAVPVTTDRVTTMPAIGWVAARTREGIVRVVNHGVDHAQSPTGLEQPLYGRYAYSSATAPLPRATGGEGIPVDNQVALIDNHGRWSHRCVIEQIHAEHGTAESAHIARFELANETSEPGPRVRSISVLRGDTEIRAALIEAQDPDEAAVQIEALVLSGFAIPQQVAGGARTGLVSDVYALTPGGSEHRTMRDLATPYGSRNDVAWVRYDRPVRGRWYVVAVTLGDRAVDRPVLSEEDSGLRVEWPDGHLTTLI